MSQLGDPAEPPRLSDALQELIGYATTDADFRGRLIAHPRKAAIGFGLRGQDLRAAARVTGARDLADYAARLEQSFAGLNHPRRIAARRRITRPRQSARKVS